MRSRRHRKKVATKARGAAGTRKKAKKKGAKKAVRKKTTKKKGAKKAGRTARAGRAKASARKKTSSSALAKVQPELEKALSRILGRARRKLNKLPRSPQLKLLQVESGGYTYTLNRLRPPPDDNLTDRQKQISRLVAQGLSNKEIARKLDISSATVAAHLRTIFTKLRVKTRTALAKHALAYYG